MHQLFVHHLSGPQDDRAIVYRTPVHDFVQRLEGIASPYPYSSRLQWMTSPKDWKELIVSRSSDGTILSIRYCKKSFSVCCVFERGEE
ncbi:hypothetical protein TNCV_2803281 [Trichonephila clavipes]|nr:hypothetical protein TNCV_2803281 [Trichonephila clavipes]